MPFAVHWMTRDIWQLVTSQGTECTDDEYRLAEKIVTRIGPVYEWTRRAIITFAGEPGSLKHNCVAGHSMSRFAFAVWCIGNGCTAELLKEWVATRKLINEPADLRNFNTLCENLVAGRITEVGGRAVTFSRIASNQWRRQPSIEWRACLGDCDVRHREVRDQVVELRAGAKSRARRGVHGRAKDACRCKFTGTVGFFFSFRALLPGVSLVTSVYAQHGA